MQYFTKRVSEKKNKEFFPEEKKINILFLQQK